VKTIKDAVKNSTLPEKETFANNADYTDYTNVLKSLKINKARL
jgi:hypothetical protein